MWLFFTNLRSFMSPDVYAATTWPMSSLYWNPVVVASPICTDADLSLLRIHAWSIGMHKTRTGLSILVLVSCYWHTSYMYIIPDSTTISFPSKALVVSLNKTMCRGQHDCFNCFRMLLTMIKLLTIKKETCSFINWNYWKSFHTHLIKNVCTCLKRKTFS